MSIFDLFGKKPKNVYMPPYAGQTTKSPFDGNDSGYPIDPGVGPL